MSKEIFIVDYYIQEGASRSRQQLQSSAQNQLNGATSEFAVQSYLQKRHSGKQITIMNLEWK